MSNCNPCSCPEPCTPVTLIAGCPNGSPSSDCVVIKNDTETCVGIIKDTTTLSSFITKIITYIKNVRNRIINTDGSLILANIVDTCDDKVNIKVRLSGDAGNSLTLTNTGLFVAPVGGTGVMTAIDSTSIDFSGNGTIATPLTAVVIKDPNATNILQISATGIYVPPAVIPTQLPITTNDTTSIDLSGDGTVATPLTAVVIKDPNPANILQILATGVYVPPLTAIEICQTLPAIFSNDVLQHNGVGINNYRFYGANNLPNTAGECNSIRIKAPTGFAVSGPSRLSAFGAMEWYDTLALATTAAIAGETVLIYKSTTEGITGKNQVNFFGIGNPSVSFMNFNLNDSSMISISNINILGTQDSNIINVSNIALTNVNILDGNTYVLGNAKMNGGRFINTIGLLQLGNNAIVSNIYSEKRVSISSGGELNNFEINYAGNAAQALLMDNTSIFIPQKVTNGVIKTINNTALFSYNGYNTITIINNITAISENGNAVYIQAGAQGVNAKSKTIANNVTGIALTTGIGLNIYQSNTLNVAVNEMTFIIENCTGISKDGTGIQGYNGNLKKCTGYSDTGVGIYIGGSDYSGKQQYIINCIGESKTNRALECSRDIFISGGTYISRGIGATANPIGLRMVNDFNQNNVWIIGVTTIAVNSTAYAIKADSTTHTVIARISGCQFLNENLLTNVPGIDPILIGNMRAVTIDAFGNTR